MQRINTIPLNSKITIFKEDGELDMYGKPTSYEKVIVDSAVFPVEVGSRVNYMQDINYESVIYIKDKILKTDILFLGETIEIDPKLVTTREIKKITTMKSIQQVIVGYKIWL